MATWVIGYGLVQSLTPNLINRDSYAHKPKAVAIWAFYLAILPMAIAVSLYTEHWPNITLVGGLLLFGVVFAINSSIHSYLIVSLADSDGVSLDVGFYYMANAMGRLIGTVLSGWVFLHYGLVACLVLSSLFLILAGCTSKRI